MMDALTLLLNRNSAPKLAEPAPDGPVLERILSSALRAPDHARLRPWRFMTVTGKAREHLGELYAQAALKRDASVSEADLEKSRKHPLRAPLLIVVVANIQQHPKVPREEQLISAGCAAHSLLLAAQAEGFAGIWRTGANAYDSTVKQGLGLAADEELVGYLYIGTIEGKYKPLADLKVEDFVSDWTGAK